MFLQQTSALLVETGRVNVSQYIHRLKFAVDRFEVQRLEETITIKSGLFSPQMINGDLHWLFRGN